MIVDEFESQRVEKKSPWRTLTERPQSLLVAAFLGSIIVGAIFLWLPFSRTRPIGILNAFFTATSAVCVTGLITVDTGKDFTLTGQVAILILIQLGALGLMTFSAMLGWLMGHRLSLRSRYILQDVFLPGQSASEFKGVLVFLVIFTLFTEAAGAFFLWLSMDGEGVGPFQAIFHSISAFCNAGFSTWSDSLCRFRSDGIVNIIIMTLIVIGGLGHIVIFEFARRIGLGPRDTVPVRISLHTRLVLWSTLILIVSGTVLFALFEIGNTLSDAGAEEGILASLFQSITTRTAGFNTVDIGALSSPTLLFFILFMLIGGSPGSTAGGFKTTTAVLLFASARSWLRGDENIIILGREVPADAGKRAILLILFFLFLLGAGALLLAITEGGRGTPFDRTNPPMITLFFEAASALGTVGLSTGITASLSGGGKIVLMILMFAGRLGPLTLASFAMGPEKGRRLGYPQERVMLG